MELNEFIFKINKPCIFKNILNQTTSIANNKNIALNWTPQILSDILQNIRLNFRIGKKSMFQYENQCDYVEARVQDFLEWLQHDTGDLKETNPFFKYDKSVYWSYADYKYMFELFDDADLRQCIDWSEFGFNGRNAKDSTMWLGTQGAYTPCHFDTYGYNLVCQIYGRKRWIMFPKDDAQFMSPIRVPFEESTVYSEINIKIPDLVKHPKFKHSHPHIIDLEPGDVLYVPHEWWHFVECLDLSISINTWVDIESDSQSRLNEILSKTLIQSLMESNFITYEMWLNTSESFTTSDENLETIRNCLTEIKKSKNQQPAPTSALSVDYESLLKSHKNFIEFIRNYTFQEYLHNYTLFTTKHDSNSQTIENDIEILDKKDENLNILFKLSKALTNPKTIEILSSLLINETD